MHIRHLPSLLCTRVFPVTRIAHVFAGLKEVPLYVLVIGAWRVHILGRYIFSTPVAGTNAKMFGGSEVFWSSHLHYGGLTWVILGGFTCTSQAFQQLIGLHSHDEGACSLL